MKHKRKKISAKLKFFYILIILTSVLIVKASVPDDDRDGVPNIFDKCPDSKSDIADKLGCSCEQKISSDCKINYIGADCCEIDEKCIDGDCVKACDDGTLLNLCSADKPKRCEHVNSSLIPVDRASKCGCPEGKKAKGEICVVLPVVSPSVTRSVAASSSAACELTSAFWSASKAAEGDAVELMVEGTEECNGLTANFEVWEDDLFFDDKVEKNPQPSIFTDGKAAARWTAEWQDDEVGNPEYYFIAKVNGKEIKPNADLEVIKLKSDIFSDNPALGCSDYKERAAQDSCWQSKAISEKNPAFCGSIKNATPFISRDACLNFVSRAKKDTSICSSIQNSEIKKNCENAI